MSQQQTTNFILEFSTQFDSDTCNTICICLRNVESPDSAFLVQWCNFDILINSIPSCTTF